MYNIPKLCVHSCRRYEYMESICDWMELLCKAEYKEQVKGGKFKRILFTYFMYEVFVLISLVERNAGCWNIESHVAKTLGLWLSFVCDIEYVTLSCMFLAKYALDGWWRNKIIKGVGVFCVRFVITLIEVYEHIYCMRI